MPATPAAVIQADTPQIVTPLERVIAVAWIGVTIDTTSGVAASSEMAGEIANRTAIVVKATQNVLIGVVAFFIALYLSTKGEGGNKQRPSLHIVWDKFPKFILAFVIASLVFSLLTMVYVGGACPPPSELPEKKRKIKKNKA